MKVLWVWWWVSAAFAAPTSGWLTKDVASVRFLGEATPGPSFDTGARVNVLVRDGAQVRVQVGDRFGWIPANAVTEAAPGDVSTAAPPPP